MFLLELVPKLLAVYLPPLPTLPSSHALPLEAKCILGSTIHAVLLSSCFP